VAGGTSLGERLLELAAQSTPLFAEQLRRHGDAPISEVLRELRPAMTEPLQSREDLWRVVGDHAASHYGVHVAQAAVADLRADPLVLTSNHFGVDTCADSVQGTLLFSLRPGPDGRRPRTITALACGSVSLDNLSYPMGLCLYDPRDGDLRHLPQRLPVFANSVRRRMVGTVGPLDEEMVTRASSRLRRMLADGEISAFCAAAAGRVLDEDVGAPGTLSLPDYGHQATRINSLLWQRMFAGGRPATQFVQLPLEEVCTDLLITDLYAPANLIYQLLFVAPVRERLLAELDGVRACWRRDRLQGRLNSQAPEPHGGTVFFWGVNDGGRRIPLTLEGEHRVLRLAGVDDHGVRQEYEFTADGIVPALLDGRLIPSLFTCFTVLAFARGLSCIGGHYQASYLPEMRRGVVTALQTAAEYRPAADLVAQAPAGLCLAVIQGVARIVAGGAAIPAGPIEIGGAGGLTDADLSGLTEMPLREACLAAFPELLGHLVPPERLPEDWERRLALENGDAGRNLIRLDCS
jgi:hypothetical protein